MWQGSLPPSANTHLPTAHLCYNMAACSELTHQPHNQLGTSCVASSNCSTSLRHTTSNIATTNRGHCCTTHPTHNHTHAPHPTPHTSHPTPHTHPSHITPTPHTSHLTPTSSNTSVTESGVTPPAAGRCVGLLPHHNFTHHTSHHTSHITPHTSHLSHPPPPAQV
jgi:hypothetical protein